MSVPTDLKQLSFHEFLGLLFDMKQTAQLVSWETFAVASIGTVVVIETKGGLQAYVITDVNFNHAALLSSFFTDVVPAAPVKGDLIWANATPKWQRNPIGATNQILRVVAGLPAWATPTGANTPVRVNGAAEGPGASLILYSRVDHVHQLAPTITGENLDWQNGDLTKVPNIFEDLNSGSIAYGGGFSSPVAARFLGSQTASGLLYIDIVPGAPAIIWNGDNATLTSLGLADLILVNVTDTGKFFHLVNFDYSGAFTGTAFGQQFGDDGSLGGATANVLFKCVAGSKFDIHQFTGGHVLPLKGINEAAPGGVLTTKAITIATQADASYGVNVTPHANDLIWVTNKTTTGFTLNYAVAGGSECDWEVFR